MAGTRIARWDIVNSSVSRSGAVKLIVIEVADLFRISGVPPNLENTGFPFPPSDYGLLSSEFESRLQPDGDNTTRSDPSLQPPIGFPFPHTIRFASWMLGTRSACPSERASDSTPLLLRRNFPSSFFGETSPHLEIHFWSFYIPRGGNSRRALLPFPLLLSPISPSNLGYPTDALQVWQQHSSPSLPTRQLRAVRRSCLSCACMVTCSRGGLTNPLLQIPSQFIEPDTETEVLLLPVTLSWPATKAVSWFEGAVDCILRGRRVNRSDNIWTEERWRGTHEGCAVACDDRPSQESRGHKLPRWIRCHLSRVKD